jgi:hypothetical protein
MKLNPLTLREIARHEAGHAVAIIVLAIDHDFTVHVQLEADKKTGRAGYVSFSPPTNWTPEVKAEVDVDIARLSRDPNYAEGIDEYLFKQSVMHCAGVAAELYQDRYWGSRHQISSSKDQENRVAEYRFWKRYPTNFWHTFDAAVELVDEEWGAIEAVADALVERLKLTRAEVEAIYRGTPKRRNEYREARSPGMLLAEAARSQLREAATVIPIEIEGE